MGLMLDWIQIGWKNIENKNVKDSGPQMVIRVGAHSVVGAAIVGNMNLMETKCLMMSFN